MLCKVFLSKNSKNLTLSFVLSIENYIVALSRGKRFKIYLAGRNTAMSGEMCQASLTRSLQILSVKTV